MRVLIANFDWVAGPKHKGKESTWIKAKEGFITVNVDSSFDAEQRSDGMIICDDKGNFLATSNNSVDFATDNATNEALAVRYELYLSNQLGCNKLTIQSDSLEVINMPKKVDTQQPLRHLLFKTVVSKRLHFQE
jgi:hypothetical protein